MNPILLIATGFLIISTLILIFKIFNGPDTIDRIIAADTATALVICIFGVIIAVARFEYLLIVMVSISLVAFVGSLALARLYFLKGDRFQEEEKK